MNTSCGSEGSSRLPDPGRLCLIPGNRLCFRGVVRDGLRKQYWQARAHEAIINTKSNRSNHAWHPPTYPPCRRLQHEAVRRRVPPHDAGDGDSRVRRGEASPSSSALLLLLLELLLLLVCQGPVEPRQEPLPHVGVLLVPHDLVHLRLYVRP